MMWMMLIVMLQVNVLVNHLTDISISFKTNMLLITNKKKKWKIFITLSYNIGYVLLDTLISFLNTSWNVKKYKTSVMSAECVSNILQVIMIPFNGFSHTWKKVVKLSIHCWSLVHIYIYISNNLFIYLWDSIYFLFMFYLICSS